MTQNMVACLIFCAYMIAMILGEVINFPIQRNVVFRSKGNLTWQIVWYAVAFCVITCIVNSINCIWVATAARYVPDFIYNIGTTVLNGSVSMVIFFFVNKVIFPTSDSGDVSYLLQESPERSDDAFARSESVKHTPDSLHLCSCTGVLYLQDRQKQAAETVQYRLCEEGTRRAAVPVTGGSTSCIF